MKRLCWWPIWIAIAPQRVGWHVWHAWRHWRIVDSTTGLIARRFAHTFRIGRLCIVFGPMVQDSIVYEQPGRAILGEVTKIKARLMPSVKQWLQDEAFKSGRYSPEDIVGRILLEAMRRERRITLASQMIAIGAPHEPMSST